MTENELALDSENMHPLPLRVGQSMVNTLHTVNNEFNDVMASMVYGDKSLVWELFCGPVSQLTQECLNNGLATMRINLAGGYDLYKDATWDALYQLYDEQKPEKLWFSPRCTYFCSWVGLNYYSHRMEVLEKYLRRERRMLRRMTAFMKYVVSHGSDIYWEWPWPCRGWKEKLVVDFIQEVTDMLKEIWTCRADME